MAQQHKKNFKKNWQHPVQDVHIHHMPGRIFGGVPGQIQTKQEMQQLIDNGSIVSEVGNGLTVKLPVMTAPIVAFPLRAPRQPKMPNHLFGAMNLYQAFSVLSERRFAMPAVGTRLQLDPWGTEVQKDLINLYRYHNYVVLWIVHVPSPLGVANLVRVFAPESDHNTKTQSVMWKTQTATTMGFLCPWSNDLAVTRTDEPRKGQSGGSIILVHEEDNSTDTVETPLSFTAWCAIVDVRCTGMKKFNTNIPMPAMAFAPQTKAAIRQFKEDNNMETEQDLDDLVDYIDEMVVLNMDNGTELNADGGSTPVQMEETLASDESINPDNQKQQEDKKTLIENKKTTKNQVNAPNRRWYPWKEITFGVGDVNKEVTLEFDPYTFSQKGEGFNLAWKRQKFMSGSRNGTGYVRGVETRWVFSRPAQISGVLELTDSTNISSRKLQSFSEIAFMPMVPVRHNSDAPPLNVRDFTSTWIKTDQSLFRMKYKLVAFNRVAEIADIKVKVYVRPGSVAFNGVTKPAPRQPSVLESLGKFLQEDYPVVFNMDDRGSEDWDDTVYNVTHEMSKIKLQNRFEENMNHMAPVAIEGCEEGEIDHSVFQEDDLDQDDFPVELVRGILTEDETIGIKIDPFVATDLATIGVENTVNQPFERFMHIIPQGEGAWGPTIGEYTVHTRLPTNLAAAIEHVCLPDDVIEESALRIFGIGSILGMAGSALSSIGGPLLGGLVNTVPKLIGDVLGLGGDPEKQQPSKEPVSLSGEVPIPRWLQMLKPIAENLLNDGIGSTLLLKARDFSTGMEELPFSVFFNQMMKRERSVFDREITPLNSFVNKGVYIPRDRIEYVVSQFGYDYRTFQQGTKQSINFSKLMKYLALRNIGAMYVNDILQQSLTEGEHRRVLLNLKNRVLMNPYEEIQTNTGDEQRGLASTNAVMGSDLHHHHNNGEW